MKRTLAWLLAVASVLGLVSSTWADLPALTPLFLPQLFGQETTPVMLPAADPRADDDDDFPIRNRVVIEQLHVMPEKVAADSDDTAADALGTCFDLLVELAPEARLIMQQLRPSTPYHLAATAFLEYLAARDEVRNRAAVTFAMPEGAAECGKDGPCKTVEVLPFPTPVPTHGNFVIAIGPNGPFMLPWGPAPYACTKAGYGCGTYPPSAVCVGAACCDDAASCPAQKCGVAACKDGKCCDKCGDGTESVEMQARLRALENALNHQIHGASERVGRDIYIDFDRLVGGPYLQAQPTPDLAVPVPYMPASLHPALPVGYPLPPPPMPHAWMAPMPHSPMRELAELHQQRELISAAIEQLEHELAQRECQQRVVMQLPRLMTVAQNVQQVHLVTDFFEAHCDTVSCVHGDPHRLLLQGDVALTCRKSGGHVQIEAPCVVLNMRDGTFSVESRPSTPPAPVAPIHGVIHYQPSAPLMPSVYPTPPVMPARSYQLPYPFAPGVVPQRESNER